MSDSISKCREPLRSMLTALDSWVTTNYPAVVVHELDSMDKEGWIDYAVLDGLGKEVTFAGARFRRDKPMGMTAVLSAKPERDPEEWVHADIGKVRRLGFAFGLPRPFQKTVSQDEWQYVFDLVAQAYAAAVAEA